MANLNGLLEALESLQVLPETTTSSTKKTRRRVRRKKPKQSTIINGEEEPRSEFHCTILPQKSTDGTCFKKKGRNDKKIENIYQFVSNDKNTYLATTNQSFIPKSKTQNDCKDRKPVTNKKRAPEKKHHQQQQIQQTQQFQQIQQKATFEEYISLEEALKGLEQGIYVKGAIRINSKFYQEAYVSEKKTTLIDICIETLTDRNRALEGDIVILKIKPENEWRAQKQKTAKVVHILEKVHSRTCVGQLIVHHEKGKKCVLLSPRDHRIPRILINHSCLPVGYMRNPKTFSNNLYLAKITEWSDVKNAQGVLIEDLGLADDIKSETVAILKENCIDYGGLPKIALEDINMKILEKDLKDRLDLRNECVFTIDPLTARDLDDALSCKLLPNGNFLIGVHIADVSHYLKEGTNLDKIVQKRATSTYLVDKCYHMLPEEMCLGLSLLPQKDSLTFSVIWEMTPNAEIISTEFKKSVINSCAQLAYEHAQSIIDNRNNPNNEIQCELPQINPKFSVREIRECILNLHMLAMKMRKKRFDDGALRIDQIKLGFTFDSMGQPNGFYKQEIKDANRTIEEFMLCANISVAKRIYEDFPDLAFLRCHEEPKLRLLNEVRTNLEAIGLHLNIENSGDLQSSILKYHTNDYYGKARSVAMNHLLAKVMTRAAYFCANNQPKSQFFHYALSLPIYTHFTSPIRRYADVMVHRLLNASLNLCPKPEWHPERVEDIAANCNDKKYRAKCAGEKSQELYLAKYVEHHQPCLMDAVVVHVSETLFFAVTLETGSVVRVFKNKLEEGDTWTVEHYGSENKMLRIRINLNDRKNGGRQTSSLVVDLFQIVTVALTRKKDSKSFELDATLVPPITAV